jgi:acetyl-CoA synthetase
MAPLRMDTTETPPLKFSGEIVWRPPAELVASSRLKRFMLRHDLATFADLYPLSIDDIEWFWKAVLQELEIEF